MNPAFPEGYSEWRKVEPRELIDAPLIKEPVQKNGPQGAAQAGEGRRRGRDRDRLRPRGRADRPRGAGGDPRREPEAAEHGGPGRDGGCSTRARYSALTKEEIDEAFANLVDPVRAARPRRRGAPGHRPDLGRDADALRVARDRPPRRAVPVGRPRAEPDARDRRRARAGAARARAQALLGGVRRVRAPRWRVRRAPQGGQVLGGGGGEGCARGDDSTRASSSRSSRSATRASRRRPSTPPPSRAPHRRSASRRRARCASPRTSTWTASSPTRAPTTPSTRSRCRVRELLQSISQVDGVQGGRPARRTRRARARRAARRRRPTTRRSTRRRRSTPACCPTTATARSTSWSCGASSATFADPSVSESTRADIEAGTETYFVRGNVLVEPGFLAVYPYGALQGRGDPEARGGPGACAGIGPDVPIGRGEAAAKTNPWFDAQGDSAAAAHRPGQADRDDGGARPRHQGDAPRHHPEALRPRLRAEQPDRAVARPASRW